MSKEVPAAELGWFPECSSCDHKTRGGLIFFSPCSLVKFSKDGNGEPLVTAPEAFKGESGELDCKEFFLIEERQKSPQTS